MKKKDFLYKMLKENRTSIKKLLILTEILKKQQFTPVFLSAFCIYNRNMKKHGGKNLRKSGMENRRRNAV
ncbi:MAG: hypothetical protein HFI44_05790 [Lachnospiraceae bacterium]|nr:hypothetical protein [Lachnospiraceae bacterium]